MKQTRKQAGKLAQSIGGGFENIFRGACNRSQVVFVRIPDGCRTYRDPMSGRPKLARTTTPFDFLLTANGKSAVIDCKTVDSNRIGYSFIDEQQLSSLLECAPSIPAGYVVWFRKSDHVVFFSAQRLKSVLPQTGLGIEDGLNLGTGGDFDVNPIFEWTDDGKSKEPVFQQRLL